MTGSVRGPGACDDSSGSGQSMAFHGVGGSGGAAPAAWPRMDLCWWGGSAVLGEAVGHAEQTSLGRDEFVEGALLPDSTLVGNDHSVGYPYVVEAMGDHHCDPIRGHSAELPEDVAPSYVCLPAWFTRGQLVSEWPSLPGSGLRSRGTYKAAKRRKLQRAINHALTEGSPFFCGVAQGGALGVL